SDSDGSTAYTLMDAVRAPTQRYDRTTSSSWGQRNVDAALGVKHVFEQGKHEISVEARRSSNGGDNDGRFLTELFEVDGTPLGVPPALMIDDRDDDETRSWAKLDYERAMGDTRLQVGYQANLQSTSN